MTNRQEKTQNKHEKSILLSDSENNDIFNCLGKGCWTLATGVVQLYLAGPSNQQRWSKRCCGVVCFVKDNPKRSYFIRLYDPKTRQQQWEQEIYHQFKYKTPREYFHTFEADDCQAGLNFASEDEAIKFKNIIEEKLLIRHKRRLEKKQKPAGSTSPNVPAGVQGTIKVGSGAPPATQTVTIDKPATNTVKENKSKGKKDNKKKKLTKEDIGTPTNFKHVSHVGWDPNIGLDMKKLDPEMKALFEQIGIDDQSNVDEETIDFIYDFVDKHGGVEALRKDLAVAPPPPPTTRGPTSTANQRPPPPPSRSGGQAPPPPPTRTGGGPPPPPPGRGMVQPPPPPPNRSPAHPPPVRQPAVAPPPPPSSSRGVPPPPPMGNVPAPPPPPPTAPMPPPPPSGPPLPTSNPTRAGLLDQIHRGTTLKHVDPDETPSDGRSGLLDQIRHGTTLKKVEDRGSDPPPAAAASGGIVGALAHALAQRKTALQGSDEEADDDDSSIETDDDEWDD